MNKELSTNKLIRRIISLAISVLTLIIFLLVKINKIQLVKETYILITIILSLIAGFSVILFVKFEKLRKFNNIYYNIVDFLFLLNAALVVTQLLFLITFYPVTVDGTSMNPTLVHEDKLLIKSLGEPKHSDIVVLLVNENYNQITAGVKNGQYIIKRIIAIPGDTFYFDENSNLILNNEIYEEKYLINKKITRPFSLNDFARTKIAGEFSNICEGTEECFVPDEYYFVLGDNRDNSVDSREIGLFHKSQILGIARYKINNMIDWKEIK